MMTAITAAMTTATTKAKSSAKIELAARGGLLGIWQIGGISYTVTSDTELNDHKSALVVGQNVKVEYKVDAAGNRVATEIKSMPKGAGGPGEDSGLVGTVQIDADDWLCRDWKIAGVEFGGGRQQQV